MLLGERLEALKWTIGGYRVETQMSESAWIFQETGSAIKALVERFIEKPYFFYTEHDMHAFLYHRLVSGKLGELFVETSSGDKTILVHREYPTLNAYVGPRGKPTRGHFDLSIIDPAHAAESHWRLHIKKPPYSRHAPKVAIEIGLNAIGTTRLDLKHFDKDLERLADPKFGDRFLDFVSHLPRPTAFLVRLLNTKSPDFTEVERFFRNIVDPVLADSGYRRFEMGTDASTEPFMNVEIFQKLHYSSLVVADLTGSRVDCFTEMGYAFGQAKKVIVTAMEGTKLPFDSHSIPCHFWSVELENEKRRDSFRQFMHRNINRKPLVS